MNEREELIKNINASLEVMKKIDKCEDKLSRIYDKYGMMYGVGFVLLYIVCILIGGGVLFAALCVSMIKESFLIIPIAVVCILFAFAEPILIRKSLIKKYEKKGGKLLVDIAKYQNEPVLSWLPDRYRFAVCYGIIIGYVSGEKVNSLQEAIDLMEQEHHQAVDKVNEMYKMDDDYSEGNP